jgi:hypothetical protein
VLYVDSRRMVALMISGPCRQLEFHFTYSSLLISTSSTQRLSLIMRRFFVLPVRLSISCCDVIFYNWRKDCDHNRW